MIATLYSYDKDFIYDVNSVTDAMGNTTSYCRDVGGNVIKIVYPAVNTPGGMKSAVEERTYNQYNQVETVTDPNGMVTRYVYYTDANDVDNYGHIWKAITDYGSGGKYLNLTTEYIYDVLGRLKTVTDPNNQTTTYKYNNLNQLVETTLPGPGYVTKNSYDYKGNRIKVQKQTSDPCNPWQRRLLMHTIC